MCTAFMGRPGTNTSGGWGALIHRSRFSLSEKYVETMLNKVLVIAEYFYVLSNASGGFGGLGAITFN